MLGVLLAFVRLRTGAIAGLHRPARRGRLHDFRSARHDGRRQQREARELVGTYDGVIGWAALVWFAVIVVGVRLQLYKPQLSVGFVARDS